MDLLKKYQISNIKYQILEYVFILCFVVLFPIGEAARIPFGNGVALVPLDIGVLLLLCVWIGLAWVHKPFLATLSKPICFFIIVCIVSLVANMFSLKFSELVVSLLYLFRWIFYAGIYFIVASSEKIKAKLPIILFISGLIILIFGYLQYFLYPALRNLLYLGWDEHYQRMFGTFLDPNFLGAFFVIYLIFLIGIMLCNGFCSNSDDMLIFSANRFGRGYKTSSGKDRRGTMHRAPTNKLVRLILIASVIPLTLIAIFLTFSRSAYLMLIVSICIFLFMIGKRKFVYGFFAVFLLFAVMYMVFFTHSKEGTDLLRSTSTFARVGSTENAWKIFIAHPIFGVGFNAYRYAQRSSGILSGSDWLDSHAGAGTDNSWLFVLGTTGIVGCIAYLYLWFTILQHAWKSRKKNIFSVIVFSSAIGLFIDSFFINSLFYSFIMVWMWSLVGLL